MHVRCQEEQKKFQKFALKSLCSPTQSKSCQFTFDSCTAANKQVGKQTRSHNHTEQSIVGERQTNQKEDTHLPSQLISEAVYTEMDFIKKSS